RARSLRTAPEHHPSPDPGAPVSAPTVPAPINPTPQPHVVGQVIPYVIRPGVGDVTPHPRGSPATSAHGLVRLSYSSTLRTALGHHLHTGSIAAYLAPGADVVARLARAARATATVSLDPNIRPALLPDAAAAHERLDALLRLADIVKASDEDLRWLYPDEDPE